jgi:hypothetical protein
VVDRSADLTCREHERVYSGNVLYTDPLMYEWVCAKCGKTGHDTDKPEKINRKRYETILSVLSEVGLER